MRWMQTEYLLKGVFLGLMADIALKQAGQTKFDWQAPALLALCIFGGLFLALAASAINKFRHGYRIRGRFLPFLLFLLLESPTLVYVGILLGTGAGAYLIRPDEPDDMLLYMVLGGVVLGLVFTVLRQLHDRRMRLGLSLVMGAALVVGALYVFGQLGENAHPYEGIRNTTTLGVFLLLGLPFFYLLTFAGQEEESEIEIGAMCATLGLGMKLLMGESQMASIAFLVPVVLYFFYTWRVLPHLRVFKHVLRGISHASVGRHAPALLALRRALQLNPNHELAREEYWKVHISLDFNDLERNPELLALVDFQLCVDRAGLLLLTQPTEKKLADAHRLLDLVISQRPRFRPVVDYWRAVAYVHENKLEVAIPLLENLLDPSAHDPRDPYRRSILLNAWQLATTLHPVLTERVGEPQLVLPGRRMEAIQAAERFLTENGRDGGVENLKKLLYRDLTMDEFKAACPDGDIPQAFDYAYAQQLGSAMLGHEHWERGVVFLRIAARGLPAISPTLFSVIAQAYEKAGRADEMWHYYEVARKAGVAVGHKNLAEQDRHNFFRVVKALGDHAMTKGDIDAAITDFSLYSEYERSGIETMRTLAELFAQKNDALAALRITDRALQYNSADRDLLEKKDSYYYSVTPEVLQANLEVAVRELDFDYCITKAKSLLDNPDAGFDLIDWADHLVTVALVVRPDSRPAKVLKARVHWRRGEIEQAVVILEQVRSPKPEKFLGADDEEAWYVSNQLLADLYLNNLGKPDLAVACLTEFRNSPRSGAKTLFRLGQAYEAMGDRTRAAKYYEQVTAYESNPLAPDAHDALARLKSG